MDPIHTKQRMIEIAARLGELYAEQERCRLGLWRCQQALAERTLHLAPPGGWPGRCREQRRLAQARALAADRLARQINQQVSAGQARLSRTQAAIARLEAERRALEWGVQADLARLMEVGPRNGEPRHASAAVHVRPAGFVPASGEEDRPARIHLKG